MSPSTNRTSRSRNDRRQNREADMVPRVIEISEIEMSEKSTKDTRHSKRNEETTTKFDTLRPISSHPSDTTHTYVEATSDEDSIRSTTVENRNSLNKKAKEHTKSRTGMLRTSTRKPELDLEAGAPKLERQYRWFSFAFGRSIPDIPSEEDRKPYPWLRVNILSQSVFFWIWPILKKGYTRTLVPDDLWYLPEKLEVEKMHMRYRQNLDAILKKHHSKILRKAQKEGKNLDEERLSQWPMHAIPYALFLTFRFSYILSCIFLACSFGCQACAPLLTKKLITFVEYSYYGVNTYNESIGYTIGATLLILVNGLLINHFFHNAMVAGAAAKSILTKDILLKSFNLSAKSRHKFTTGRITSLMTTDLSRIDLAIGFQPLVLCFPIPVTIAIALLLKNAGVTSLAGVGLFVFSLIACVLLTSKLFFTRETVVKFTDERISLMREVLSNLKIIKFYAWESAYKKRITNVRSSEMRYLFTMEALRKSITAYAVTLPTLTSMVSFVTMWATNSMRSPSDVFSSLSLFSILAQAIMLLPIALATGADAAIGFKRCKDYLEAEELEEHGASKGNHLTEYWQDLSAGFSENDNEKTTSDVAIEVSNADFVWEQLSDVQKENNSLWKDVDKLVKNNNFGENHRNTPMRFEGSSEELDFEDTQEIGNSSSFKGLRNINLRIEKGDFVVITGMIGSGKSSLLNALAGFMKLSNPETAHVSIKSDLLLCGAPWIQNATVRENILFGRLFDRSYYDKVIAACCLDDDIKQLSHGDLTEIGEKGVTLSGGQKARINLARAVYNNSSILLFDDVLSAVDSRVGKHITNQLFEGLLKNHTRILATHQLSLVSSADKIVYLNGDGSIDVGTTMELLSRNTGFKKLFQYSDEATKQMELMESKGTSNGAFGTVADGSNASPRISDTQERAAPSERGKTRGIANEPNSSLQSPATKFGKTIEDEDVCINAVSWDVYKKYIQMGQGVFGNAAIPLFLTFVALSTFCQLFTNTWLSFWMEKRFSHLSDRFYVTIYVVLAVLTVCFTAIQFTLLAYMNNKSAQTLNVKATEKVLHVPMSFMDTNPLGRVLNRFTRDTDSLDNALGEQLTLFIFPLATIIGIIILCIIYLPWFAIAVPFLAIAFLFFTSLYSASSREIKRIEAVQRSVVYNNFNETLHGMATIKAYKSEATFVQKNDYLLNRMNEAYFLSIATQRWLCVHLDALAAVFALIIVLLCVTNQFEISASSTGLLLNYVIQIVGLLSLTVRAMTQVETEMNSVERLHSYAFELPQEASYEKSEIRPPKEWPIAGYIQFNNVSFRYRPSLPLVLNDVTFGAYPGEKLGICGRTGAGKSSIMTALYRLNELERGSITIDGLNTAQMGLRDLRSKLSIIPQDPVLFQGTIRRNLDPFQQYSDDVLWDSLRRSGSVDSAELPMVRATRVVDGNNDNLHKFHLDQVVEDDGSNFSLGEKQLIALARSLVRDTKILILDEATSSVDYETDAKIQRTIAAEFGKSTILCIAHRLKTILDYDRILVMDDGQIAEKGVPWVLFKQNGLFRKMCDKAHITAEDFHKV